MKITMVSNFLNHHQLPLAEEFYRLLGDDYLFVATEVLPEERATLGYHDMNEKYSFCKCAYKSKELWDCCEERIFESDVVIFAYMSSPKSLIERRLKARKLTFFYTERIFKKIPFDKVPFRRKAAVWWHNISVQTKPVYLLCASAFTSLDFSKLGLYKDKCFKWGYFPETITTFPQKENPGHLQLLWVGRFLDWKHPEMAVYTVKELLQRGHESIHLKMIGTGEMFDGINQLIVNEGLQNNIELCGSMTPEQVRLNMQKSHVFLMTSDRNEGWGAVLNESMNSACIPIVNHLVGSAPFLAKQKVNSLIYRDGDLKDLVDNVEWLISNLGEIKTLSENAYHTIVDEWNSRVAAERLVESIKSMQSSKLTPIFAEGPMSAAFVLSESYYKQ